MLVQIATNLKCSSCLAKLQPRLDNFEGMKSWHADLNHPRKIVYAEVDANSDLLHVLALIQNEGFEAVIVDGDERQKKLENQSLESPSFLSTYKPLFLVITYVLGATLLTMQEARTWEFSRGAAYFMGFFFLGFAFFKLLDVARFADAFATYDILAKRSRAYALAYPWIEIILGIMFVAQIQLLAANIATAFVMSIGLVGVISAVRKKQKIQCACLGTVFNLPMSAVTIVENSTMIAMSGIMIANTVS